MEVFFKTASYCNRKTNMNLKWIRRL